MSLDRSTVRESPENEKSVPHKEFTDTDKADKDKIKIHSRYLLFIVLHNYIEAYFSLF
jgi:hypothetical protein